MQSFNAEHLQEKWAPLLDHEGMGDIKDNHRRMVTAVLLENQEKTLKEEQEFLGEAAPTNSTGAGISNYVTGRQNLSLLNQVFGASETRQVRFNRLTDKLYIDMDWDTAVEIGDAIIALVFKKIDGSTYTELFNDIFLKKYVTSLFKKQWGANLIKYEGVQLPGGVTLNGRQIYDDGNSEVEKLEEEMQMRYQLPDNFYVG